MSTDRYRTIAGTSEGIYRELASKFIARAFPIADEAEFKAITERFGNEHPSSRHVCYAWVLGDAADRHRANDDGEPSGTAGLPILRRIRSLDLTYCGVAVVRYFGGTLLGKPGLIHAYGEAARLALEAAEIIEHVVMERADITCGYDRFDALKADVLAHGGRIADSTFTTHCTATIEMPKGILAKLLPKWGLLGIAVDQP
ncbi:MAG: YigZ family protein [Flavobacteriales bacterium]|nr:YigZ family protein [Flavobacteriales bacterium]